MIAMPRRPIADLVLLCAGFTIWASAFVALYAILSIGCAWGWEETAVGPLSLQRAMLAGVWLVHVVPAAALVVWTRRRARRLVHASDPSAFLARASFWTNSTALLATILNFLPIGLPSACL